MAVRLASMFASARGEMSKLNKRHAQAQQSRSLSPERKREELDKLDRRAVDLARRVLERYDGK